MAHLYRLICIGALAVGACWALLQPLVAHAAFPATGGGYVYQYLSTSGTYVGSFPTATAACVASRPPNSNFWVADSATDLGNCLNGAGYAQPVTWIRVQGSYSCPANSTLNGTNCTCNSGYTQSGSTCVDPLAQACAALAGQTTYVTVPGQQSVGGSVCGPTGCGMAMGSPLIRAKNPAGQWITEGEATFSGSTCTASAPSAPQAVQDPCPDGQPGTVNDQPVCIPYVGGEVERETGKSETTTGPDGTKQTTTTSVTSCTGNSCTTTTTNTTVVNGGTPTTTTTQTEQPRNEYCQQNPLAPQCKESSFSGSCGAGFSCQGDAVQCATARELHAISCGLKAESPESALYAASANATPGPADIPSNTVSVGPGDLDSSNALGVAACLADLPLTVAGTSVTLPLSSVCGHLEYLRLMLLAVAYLMAFRIVARG